MHWNVTTLVLQKGDIWKGNDLTCPSLPSTPPSPSLFRCFLVYSPGGRGLVSGSGGAGCFRRAREPAGPQSAHHLAAWPSTAQGAGGTWTCSVTPAPSSPTANRRRAAQIPTFIMTARWPVIYARIQNKMVLNLDANGMHLCESDFKCAVGIKHIAYY